MSENAQKAYEVWKSHEGTEESVGEWIEISQERINQFADVTEDHQFIHVDPERAKQTPFGTTIAHGFLTLSMLTKLESTIPAPQDAAERYAGIAMGLNYGFEKVRFISPVTVGSRIRVHSRLAAVELKGNAIQTTRTMTVEIEGGQKPAVVADWLTRLVYA